MPNSTKKQGTNGGKSGKKSQGQKSERSMTKERKGR
jgi:hypothetical protein